MPDDLLHSFFSELAATQLPVPGQAGVIARGRQRRRRARGRTVLAAVTVAALAAVAASQLAGSHPARPLPVTRHRTVPGICTAAPDAVFLAALRHSVPIGERVIAVSPDGTVAYADVDTAGFHGIAEENVATGAFIRRIARLPASAENAQGVRTASGDLLWYAIIGTHGEEASTSTPVRLWSPRTGRVSTLEPPGQDGIALSAPVLFQPGGTVAAWLQADGSQREIVEANLGTGVVDVVAVGYVGPPVFVGSSLVWSAAKTSSSQPSHLVAMNASAFPASQPVAIPRQLRAAGPGVLMGSGPEGSWPTPLGLIVSYLGATAYYSADLTELFYSPAPGQPARMLLRAPANSGGFTPGSLTLGPGYLGWGNASAASALISTTNFAMVSITNGGDPYFGGVQGVGSYVLATRTGSPKKAGSPTESLIADSVIAGLRCAPAGSHGSSRG